MGSVGLVVLVGVVVNNGIVLVDLVTQLRNQGMERVEALVHAGAIDAARVLRAIRALAPVAPAAAAPSLRAAQRMALVGLPDDQAEARATFTKWWLGQMTKDVSPTSRLYPYRRAAGDDAAMAAYLDWAEKAQADVKAVDRDLANEAMRALGSTKDLEYLTEVLQKHGDAEADAKHLWAGAIIGASQSAYLRKKTAAWFMERPDSAARMAIFQEVFADYPDEAVVFLAKAGKDLKRVKPKDRPSVLSVGLGACSGEPVEELAKAVETWNSDASKGVIADLRAGVTACEAWRKDEMATVVGLLKVD
ncbi:MAG: hypothetical protein KC656_32275, partial [Myxococcales bacterium]|nr:hypothetical protein [Myxococcales bacterium]